MKKICIRIAESEIKIFWIIYYTSSWLWIQICWTHWCLGGQILLSTLTHVYQVCSEQKHISQKSCRYDPRRFNNYGLCEYSLQYVILLFTWVHLMCMLNQSCNWRPNLIPLKSTFISILIYTCKQRQESLHLINYLQWKLNIALINDRWMNGMHGILCTSVK